MPCARSRSSCNVSSTATDSASMRSPTCDGSRSASLTHELQLHGERHQVLLGPVVQVPLDRAPSLVAGGHDAPTRRLQLGGLAPSPRRARPGALSRAARCAARLRGGARSRRAPAPRRARRRARRPVVRPRRRPAARRRSPSGRAGRRRPHDPRASAAARRSATRDPTVRLARWPKVRRSRGRPEPGGTRGRPARAATLRRPAARPPRRARGDLRASTRRPAARARRAAPSGTCARRTRARAHRAMFVPGAGSTAGPWVIAGWSQRSSAAATATPTSAPNTTFHRSPSGTSPVTSTMATAAATRASENDSIHPSTSARRRIVTHSVRRTAAGFVRRATAAGPSATRIAAASVTGSTSAVALHASTGSDTTPSRRVAITCQSSLPEQEPDRRPDGEREEHQGGRLPDDREAHLAPPEPERAQDREIDAAAASRRQQHVHERPERGDREDDGEVERQPLVAAGILHRRTEVGDVVGDSPRRPSCAAWG